MSLLVTMAGLTVVTEKWAEREPFRFVRDKEKRLEEGEKADTIENGVGNKACDISTCAITKKLGFLVKDFFSEGGITRGVRCRSCFGDCPASP